MNVRFGPLHDLAQFFPIVHIGEIQILHRGAGDDHAVIFLVLDLIKGGIEREKMIRVGILRCVAGGLQQLHLHLQRRVGQLAQQLGLRNDFGGHQIQNQNVQGADILMHGTELGHNKNVFALQHRAGRERVGNTNGHVRHLLTGVCDRNTLYIHRLV